MIQGKAENAEGMWRKMLSCGNRDSGREERHKSKSHLCPANDAISVDWESRSSRVSSQARTLTESFGSEWGVS